MPKKTETAGRARVVAVSMGYGHQRTAYPLRHLTKDGAIINANDYPGIPKEDKVFWETSRRFYELISNVERIPLIGKPSFKIFDQFQKILRFYPKRKLSEPTLALKRLYALIQNGWGEHLIGTLKSGHLPLVTTFFTPAFMAEYFRYPGKICCIIPDTDVSRTWVPLKPQNSRIQYFAPAARVVERLMLYGVSPEHIFLTGYPLPKEILGSTKKFETARADLGNRILNLDPRGAYCRRYAALIKQYLGRLPKKSNHPLTVLFSIGGAGAQKEIAAKVLKSLANKIREGAVRFIIAAGGKGESRQYFTERIAELKLEPSLKKSLELVWDPDASVYFQKFNRVLRTTDILWTKPSELSFYTALGLPIIIAPPLGSHEEFNREWLLKLGSGMPQEDPRYVSEWLFDYVKSGWFAEAATQGFVEAEKMGTFNIERIISRGRM